MVSRGLFTSSRDDWRTPDWLFDSLNAEFRFTLDPCSTDENAKCVKHYTQVDDGLSQPWDGERVFCNPPYGRQIGRWVKKAAESRALVVMLLPARTDTRWFHNYIYHKAEIRFLSGRLTFGGPSLGRAPFPSMIVIFNPEPVTKYEDDCGARR